MRTYHNFDLTPFNAYRTLSKCKMAIFPESEEDFIEIFQSMPRDQIIIIGNGNNIILSKQWYDETFLILNNCFDKLFVKDSVIEAESGATILDVSLKALEHELTGAEFLYDIPSSVGGAVVMNAGTKEGETKNILKKVRYLDLDDLSVNEKTNEEIQFEYRNSFFQKNKDKVILKAWFELKPGNFNAIDQLMQESKARRWARQPREYPNCGSVFKRPPGRYVGPMIDELGLKGHTIGGAQVSSKHSGFIINIGEAKGEEILSLIAYVKGKVLEKFGVDLEVEQRVI